MAMLYISDVLRATTVAVPKLVPTAVVAHI